MVGIRLFPLGMGFFQVRTVSFREGTVFLVQHLISLSFQAQRVHNLSVGDMPKVEAVDVKWGVEPFGIPKKAMGIASTWRIIPFSKYTLVLQIPFQEVFRPSKPAQNTLSEGSWSTRDS